jgi:hypothetical protein
LFGDKRISNPQTVLHLTPEFTFPELGYVSLAELASVRGALGLPVVLDVTEN